MTRTEEFIRDLLVDHDPAAGNDVPPSDRRYAAQRLQAAMADTTTEERPVATEASRSWWSRRRLRVATAVAGVLTVVAALVISRGVRSGDGGIR